MPLKKQSGFDGKAPSVGALCGWELCLPQEGRGLALVFTAVSWSVKVDYYH